MIRQLDKQLINKIAAGEVVERPLSVVKELTENAIDAGAGLITVEIKEGGLSLIRVTDNGCGIPPDQVMLAFAQHATSKITDIEDLQRIGTLGFRGEALASIASVSYAEMLTKTAGALAGTRVELHGGTLVARQDLGCAEGSTIKISNLFFNTPARLKFMKKPASEAAYVTELMQRLALGNPHLAFRYISNGQQMISTNGSDLKTAIYHIYGRDAARGLLPVEGDFVSGFIGKPEIARGSRSAQNFFVNGRYIKSGILQSALEEAYHLPVGRFPLCVLHINIPPEELDVNVHPAKTEVRFADERGIYEMLSKTLSRTLASHELVPEIKPRPRPVRVVQEKATVEEDSRYEELDYPLEISLAEEFPLAAARTQESEYKVIGQIWGTYWLALREEELFLIDQHAAHERLLYEELLHKLKNSDTHAQTLLKAVSLNLSPSELAAAAEHKSLLENFGFAFEINDVLTLHAVPMVLDSSANFEFFTELLGKLEKGGHTSPSQRILEGLAITACKSAVKANDQIGTSEARALIYRMLALDDPYHCPHGRPTMIKLSRREIERMFKRI